MILFFVILGGGAVYLLSLAIHPWWSCTSCQGKQVRQGAGRSHGRCWKCKGNGRYPRVGVRILMPGRARQMLDGRPGRHF